MGSYFIRCWSGGGAEMALVCDIRIASENAIFGLTELRWELILGGGGTQRLPRLIGVGKTLDMILCAETIDAKEVHRIGLVRKW